MENNYYEYLNAVIDHKSVIIKVYGSENERVLDKYVMFTNGEKVYDAKLINGRLVIKKSK